MAKLVFICAALLVLVVLSEGAPTEQPTNSPPIFDDANPGATEITTDQDVQDETEAPPPVISQAPAEVPVDVPAEVPVDVPAAATISNNIK